MKPEDVEAILKSLEKRDLLPRLRILSDTTIELLPDRADPNERRPRQRDRDRDD